MPTPVTSASAKPPSASRAVNIACLAYTPLPRPTQNEWATALGVGSTKGDTSSTRMASSHAASSTTSPNTGRYFSTKGGKRMAALPSGADDRVDQPAVPVVHQPV